MYRCAKCEKQIEELDQVRCPYCGFRIIVKERPKVVKRVKSE